MDKSGKMSWDQAQELTEEEFLAAYKVKDYARPSVTVDLVILTMMEQSLKILLIERKGHPHKGKLALPGGFIDVGDAVKNQGESLEAAAHRELQEETGIPAGTCRLFQIGAFGDPYRDPRTRVVSVAYVALVQPDWLTQTVAGDDAALVCWKHVDEATSLAFDHDIIVSKALTVLKDRLLDSDVAFSLVPAVFTVGDLLSVYTIVNGPTSTSSFYKKFSLMIKNGVVERVPSMAPTTSKPRRQYKFVRSA